MILLLVLVSFMGPSVKYEFARLPLVTDWLQTYKKHRLFFKQWIFHDDAYIAAQVVPIKLIEARRKSVRKRSGRKTFRSVNYNLNNTPA